MKNFFRILLISILFISSGAHALETDWQDSSEKQEGSIQLISGGYEFSNKITSAIHLKFAGNWKTYWKHTGDSGMSVTASFTKSENIKQSEVQWPVPERHSFYDLEGWGYGGEVMLPVVSEVIDNTKPAKLVVNVKWAACDENCIFIESDMELEIPAAYKDADTLLNIAAYQGQVPVKIGENSDIKLKSLVVTDKTVTAEFTAENEAFKDDLDLFIFEQSKNFRFPKPTIIKSPDGKTLTIRTNYEILKQGETLKGKTLELTLRNGLGGAETEYEVNEIAPPVPDETAPLPAKASDVISDKVKTTAAVPGVATGVNAMATGQAPQEEPKAQPAPVPDISLVQAIIAAVIGGMILNIMPCVLPVILLKIFGAIKHGGSDKRFIRKSFSYTVLGIITSFMLIAVFVVALKTAGHSIGWGIQFQQPVFLIFLSILLTLFAANQFGWFEINLHTKLSDKINDRLEHAGEATPLGNFLTGAFATLLATPCTAPYLVTAISFAFAASASTIFIVFFFMGVGLSMPYILVMMMPSIVRIFPRPGRWMAWVKVFLGLLLLLTNFWIFWIFFSNGGPNSGFMLLVCTLLMTLWLFVARMMKLDRTKVFFTVLWMIFCTFGITLYLVKIEKEPENMKDAWVKFERSEIDKDIAEGKTVFVDVTADWCLTCKFNKANVIYPMKEYFTQNNIIMMKADYTTPSQVISDYLAANKSYGIPLNMMYGPHAKEGLKMPVLLKEDDIKQAYEKAK